MDAPAKKIVKYVIVVGLLVGLVFLLIKVFFPTPNPTDAYNRSVEIQTNQTYLSLIESSEALEDLMEAKQAEVGFSQKTFDLLRVSHNLILSLETANRFMQPQIIYASNTGIYNSATRQINRIYGDIETLLTDIESYLDSSLNAYLDDTAEKSVNTIVTYSSAVANFNINLVDKYYELTCLEIQVFNDLPRNYTINNYSVKLLSIFEDWSDNLNRLVKTKDDSIVNFYANSNSLLNFSSEYLTADEATAFYLDAAQIANRLEYINQVNITDIIKVIETSGEADFVTAIENDATRTLYQNTIAFLKGEVI